jgi:hypothetical protein
MRAGASSSVRRLSVEMDEYAVAYINLLKIPLKLHLLYSKSCSSGSSHLKLLFGKPITYESVSSICPLVALEVLVGQCLWVEYRCSFPLNLPSSRLCDHLS